MNYFQYSNRLVKGQLWAVFMLACVTQPLFAQDGDISVNPTSAYFNEVAPGSVSEPVTLVITNYHATDTITLETTIYKRGPGEGEFNFVSDGCSNTTIAASSSCNLQIRFEPTSEGSKYALISIPYTKSSGGSGELMAYLSTNESAEHQVERRLPPVVDNLEIPEEMNASTKNTTDSTYDLNWTVVGYQEGYKSKIVMFDCTEIIAPEVCGADYNNPTNDLLIDSALLSPNTIIESDLTYGGEFSKKYYFTFPYTVTAKLGKSTWPGAGTEVVIRFYVVSDEDTVAEKPNLSLIIPGNLSNDYYDTSGRKIKKVICPSDGCVSP